jgi:hypothetical protein
MRSLLLRLSALDADAATAVRVIDSFDALVAHRASAEALVRATAGLAECGVGMRLADGRQWRFSPAGDALSGTPHTVSVHADFELDQTGGTLWLERDGEAAPMDELVLERACLAARILLNGHRSRRVAGLVDPSLMEMALSSHESLPDRCRALRQLGLIPDQPVRAAAVRVSPGGDPAVEAIALCALAQPARLAYVAAMGGVGAVLFQQRAAYESPAVDLRAALRGRSPEQRRRTGVHIGVGAEADGTEAQRSWQQALTALRFARPADICRPADDLGEAVADYDELGILALLAEIPPQRLAGDPLVAALRSLAATENGALDIATLEVYCRTGSLRRTAEKLYLHHSTVSFRLARIEESMAWHLGDPAGRFRAQLALWAYRLLCTSDTG